MQDLLDHDLGFGDDLLFTKAFLSLYPPNEPSSPVRLRWLCRAWALFGLLLFGLTWRLWTPQAVYPQIPLFGAAGQLPLWLEWLAFALMVGSMVVVLLLPDGKPQRVAMAMFGITYGLQVCVDQHRLQPWAYQIFLLGCSLAINTPRRALGLVRLLLISIYLFSALSKFDYQFLHTLGQQFLLVLTGFVGIAAENWHPELRICAAGVFPLAELLVAVGLFLPQTRHHAVWAAVALHGVLVLILGPGGLDHQPAVLVWNLFFATLAVVLFWKTADEVVKTRAEGGTQRGFESGYTRFAHAITLCAVFLPLLEPFGWFDHWPAWQLYAPRNSRVIMYVDADGATRLTSDLKTCLGAVEASGWRRLYIDRWSLDTLKVPIYPQDRFQLGVALAVAQRCQLNRAIQVICQSDSSRWNGERKQDVLYLTDAIATAANKFRLNAKPRNAGWVTASEK